jgi:antitoxin MazE
VIKTVKSLTKLGRTCVAREFSRNVHKFLLRIVCALEEKFYAKREHGGACARMVPKRLLQQIGLVDQAELRVEGEALVLWRPKVTPREGWAEASKAIAASSDDALVLPEFANEGDAELLW